MLLNLFLVIVCAFLAVSYFLQKWGKLIKMYLGEGKSYLIENAKAPPKTTLRRFNHFTIPIPIIDGFYTFYKLRKDGVYIGNKWANQIGPNEVVELPLGPYYVLMTRDAKVINKLLSSSDAGHLSKPQHFYDRLFVDVLTKGLLATEYKVWSQQRKIIARAFTFRSFLHYIKSMNKHTRNLTKELKQLCLQNGGRYEGRPLLDLLDFNTLKITLEFIMGSEHSDREDALQFTRDLLKYKDIVGYRFLHPELYFPPLWWLHPKRREADKLSYTANNFVRRLVAKYMENLKVETEEDENEQRCLIVEMLKHGAHPEEIHNEIGTFLVAGHETIAMAINLLVVHLGSYPDLQSRCRDEVDALFDAHSDDPDFQLNMDHLSQLEYVERFICESLRISPTVPFYLRQVETPLKLDNNVTLEPRKTVMISALMIHHNPAYYPDPDKFDPDRFLPEEVEKRGPGTFIPFSGGLRNCIGRRFAMLEMKVTIAWLLRNFEMFSEDKVHDVKHHFEATVKPERDYKVSFKIRETA